MTDFVVASLILDLLEWLAKQDRSYDDTMDAWRTTFPNCRCGKMLLIAD